MTPSRRGDTNQLGAARAVQHGRHECAIAPGVGEPPEIGGVSNPPARQQQHLWYGLADVLNQRQIQSACCPNPCEIQNDDLRRPGIPGTPSDGGGRFVAKILVGGNRTGLAKIEAERDTFALDGGGDPAQLRERRQRLEPDDHTRRATRHRPLCLTDSCDSGIQPHGSTTVCHCPDFGILLCAAPDRIEIGYVQFADRELIDIRARQPRRAAVDADTSYVINRSIRVPAPTLGVDCLPGS